MSRLAHSLAFVPRQHHRFAARLPVHYLHARYVGKGTITNVSFRGWRVVGHEAVDIGDLLTFRVPIGPSDAPGIDVQARVRWARGDAFGVELYGRQPRLEHRLRNWVRAMAKTVTLTHPLSTL